MTWMIVVEFPPLYEQNIMVPFKSAVTLSINNVDVSGEIDVLKIRRVVSFIISGAVLLEESLDEVDRDSDGRNEKVHRRTVSFVWHVRTSCPPGHTDAVLSLIHI